MKEIYIETEVFFELLKTHQLSMWNIFAQMVDKEPQKIIFVNDKKEILFDYILPNKISELKKDQKKFTEEFKKKLSNFL